MFDISIWGFFTSGVALLLLTVILSIRGFGLIKLKYLNFKTLHELKKLRKKAESPQKNKALATIINHCNVLNSKWVLEESDFNLLDNTYLLAKKIASLYHPDSKHPVEEAKVRWVLYAFMELKSRLLVIATTKSIHRMTQFRIRHIVILSRAWKLKKSLKQSKTFIFFKKFGFIPLFKWFFFTIRFLDLAFWFMKMVVYVIQNIVFKVFLVRWYLIVGELAVLVYSEREKEPKIEPESILKDLDAMTEYENPLKGILPEQIQKISELSRNEILYHTWSVEWTKVRGIYIDLVRDIAYEYNPRAKQPIYEVKLLELLISAVRFSEQIAAIQTYPFVNKLLDLRITHALVARDAADLLSNNNVLSWVKKYKLNYIFKYSLLLFKTLERKHPTLLFKDFAFILAREGCKRWFYLYLHHKLTLETNNLYRESKITKSRRFSPPRA